ncbi:TadE family protein [Methylobacterium sp. 4-46]|uniref:TadE family protein n=1 Tax=unclassified Methylobacterium TaxID=2615210 RepID=UPI000165C5B9|nr:MULTISPECIES: TadE family protein [Methylobacterium]ACA18285.1 TadE family protein [Methylobacterium sp. 4-46]WFT77584.1 pilus assembly protein [Methylobacterium nodulans]
MEFALLTPALIVLAFGLIEFGLIVYTLNSAESAARDVTRQLATNRISAAQASDAVIRQLPAWVAAGTTISVTQTAPGDPANNRFTTDVAFSAAAATPTTLLNWAYGSVVLHARVSMQQEPGS